MEIYDLAAIPLTKLSVVGGKARGLHELSRAGLNIAKGFVIADIDQENDLENAVGYYEKSGLNMVAVRSSATSEDGGDFSNAGQYSSFLNVSGAKEVREAIMQCILSLQNSTASSYAAYFDQAKSKKMSVIVQEMICAQKAGVCFTRDPLTGEKSILIEAVHGLGEQLVSGWTAAQQYRMTKGKTGYSIVQNENAGEDILLNPDEIDIICSEAVKAETHMVMPLDTEWAIDEQGLLFWLQARPITTLEEPWIGELDVRHDISSHIITKCNIGEMLPGAVTPLSLSTSVHAIDWGMRKMFVYVGAFKSFAEIPDASFAFSVGNHLFLDITAMYRMADCVLGASADAIDLSICGKVLENVPKPARKRMFLAKRVINGIKYVALLQRNNKARREIEALAKKFSIPLKDNAEEQFSEIEKNMQMLNHCFWLHYITSCHSGSMSSALFFILNDDLKDAEKAKSLIASVLEDIDDIESVDILRSLRRLARAVLKEYPDAAEYSAEELSKCIKNGGRGIQEAYVCFTRRHGHRAIREAEIRSKGWSNDEKGMMDYLKSVLKTDGAEPVKEKRSETAIQTLAENYRGIKKKALLYIIGQARTGVINREYSKSMCIKIFNQFKTSYAHLASLMVENGSLPEVDLIYFLQHKEIERLLYDGQSRYVKKALARKRLLEEQKELKFNDVYVGKPEPVKLDVERALAGTVLNGAPISRGTAAGRARVVKSIEDANMLQKGEIMVACFTDIGWSPYYCLLGALVTEVGSALSHGAVVAREYALPLVANVAYATEVIRTGDMLLVNGTNGTVTIL